MDATGEAAEQAALVEPRPATQEGEALMSWSVTIAPMPREYFAAVMEEHKVAKGGHIPDMLVNIIIAEAGTLGDDWPYVALNTFGHCGSGSPRYARFDVTGAKDPTKDSKADDNGQSGAEPEESPAKE